MTLEEILLLAQKVVLKVFWIFFLFYPIGLNENFEHKISKLRQHLNFEFISHRDILSLILNISKIIRTPAFQTLTIS